VGFKGWPAEALEFYEGLEADNTRTYWLAHKPDYDDLVRAPMQALLDELAPAWGAGKIFRPYRDVRFSADKTPYKTHIGARLEGGGYIQLGADGLAAALAGCATHGAQAIADTLVARTLDAPGHRSGDDVALLVLSARPPA